MEDPEKKDDLLRSDYSLDPVEEQIDVQVPEGQEGEFFDLPHLEKIKLAAQQHGVSLKDPDKDCNKCHGRGYVSVRSFTISADDKEVTREIPNPCKCVFEKHDLPKMFTGMISLGRKERHRNDKRERRITRKEFHTSASNILEHKLKKEFKVKRKKKKKQQKKDRKRNRR